MLFSRIIIIISIINRHYKCLNGSVNSFFPYNTWIIPFFFFTSGIIFTKSERNKNFSQFILSVFEKVLIPALFMNICYGIISTVMNHYQIVTYGQDLSFYNLLISPFFYNDQFKNSIYLWLFFQLFIIELIAGSAYYFLSKIPENKYKLRCFLLLLAVSFLTAFVCLRLGCRPKDFDKEKMLIIRTGYLSFFFVLGLFYGSFIRNFFEKYPYPVLGCYLALICQVIASFFDGVYYPYDPYTMNMKGLKIDLMPFFSFLCAAVFIICLARVLSPVLSRSRLLNSIGNDSDCILCHFQFFGIMIGVVTLLICAYHGNYRFFDFFDSAAFKNEDCWAAFEQSENGLRRMPYFIIPFFGPVLTVKFVRKFPDRRIQFLICSLIIFILAALFIMIGRHYQNFLRSI